MSSLTSRISTSAGLIFLSVSAHAALLDFTVPSSGFSVESYTAVAGSNPAGAITAGAITGEAGFQNILLDIAGEDIDIAIDDVLSGNPYFDSNSSGKEGGLGSCRNLTGSAQCSPNSDDNLTIAASESLRFDFQNDAGQTVNVLLGDFTFRDDSHDLINGSVQVTHNGGSEILAVTGGIADFSVIGPATYLIFNDEAGATSNYYISSANITAVPVPAAGWLMGSALGMLAWTARKRKRAKA
jgi:hypothetical protein